jgi:RNA polymerase sigma-70 factor (ECF subfamily)
VAKAIAWDEPMDVEPNSIDETEFAAIVREHQGMVFSIALHVVGRRDLAEELAQEVFIQLYRHIRSIESPVHLKFWLRKTAAHRAIDCARREVSARWVSLDGIDEPIERSEGPVEEDPFAKQRLQRLLASLAPKARMIVALRYQEEMEPREIAEILDMPLNTVKSSLQRSLALLRAKFPKPLEGVRS